jgi:hypothetical protein
VNPIGLHAIDEYVLLADPHARTLEVDELALVFDGTRA